MRGKSIEIGFEKKRNMHFVVSSTKVQKVDTERVGFFLDWEKNSVLLHCVLFVGSSLSSTRPLARVARVVQNFLYKELFA